MTINSVLIAGAGAVGLTVADTLYAYNPQCVRILAGGERLVRYREQGLYINGKRTPLEFAPASADIKSSKNKDESLNAFKPDLIIIASKFHNLTQIIDDIEYYISKDTLILSLLNGISSEQIIGERYGEHRIPLAMILGTDAQHDGTQTTYTQRGIIHFGEPENPVPAEGAVTVMQTSLCSPRVRLIADFFTRAKLPFEIPENMQNRLWFKFMVNVGINQCSAVIKQPYAPFQHEAPNHPHACIHARALMESAMREVIAIAQAEKISLSEQDIDTWYKTLDDLNPGSKTSMCQDVCAGRKTEVELFAQTVMELGKKHAIPVPVNQTLFCLLKTIEQQNTTNFTAK